MKANQITKLLTILILPGMLIFGCRKDTNQGSVKSISAIAEKSVTLTRDLYVPRIPMPYFTTLSNTDYLSVGTGGLRDVRYGQIKVTGTFPLNSVTKVYLYWHANSPVTQEVAGTIKFNGNPITGTTIGITRSNNGPNSGPNNEKNSQAYRADVTATVKSSSSRIFTVSDFGVMNPDGASLILFYSDGDSSNNRDIVLFEGNDSNGAVYSGGPDWYTDPAGWDVLLSGINYSSGKVNITMHVADGQSYQDGELSVNGHSIGTTSGFAGNSVPGATSTTSARWDIRSWELSGLLSAGRDSLHIKMPASNADLLSLVVVVFNLPKGAAPPIQVPFDYRPNVCFNSLLTSSKGAEEAAIYGTPTFDVRSVDVSSVKLNGIPFKKSRIIDVSALYFGAVNTCFSCWTLPPDGINDLEFLFDNQLLLKTLGTVQDKQCVKVTLTGKLLPQYNSTPIKGEDVILISKE